MPNCLTYKEAAEQLSGKGGEFEIVEETIRGVTYRVFGDSEDNLHQCFAEAAAKFGDRELVVYDSTRLTFSEVYSQACAIADQLVNRFGIEPGDRVAIGMRNYPEWVVSFMAITSIGAISVSLNSWWTGAELEFGLREVDARLAILDKPRWERLKSVAGTPDTVIVGARWPGDVPSEVVSLKELADAGAGRPMPARDVGPDDDATILFTSGTTGFPKGAVATHRGILCTIAGWRFSTRARQLMGAIPVPDEQPAIQPAILMPLPLFHVTGSQVGLMASIKEGRRVVLMYRWDADEALRLIERERVTAFIGVPTMASELLESPELPQRDVSSLTNLSGGGAPIPGGMLDRLRQRMPAVEFTMGWGMTETNAAGTSHGFETLLERRVSSGRVSPIGDMRIVDDKGNELPTGQEGVLLTKSPCNIRCYWNQPEATRETIVDGWLDTGDVAKFDEDGFLYIVDRKKDMVLRGGENIYCAEVERVLFAHPAVLEAAVFGLPDQRLGEQVAAVVMLKPDVTVSAEDLCRHVGEQLAAFKVPATVLFWEEQLPRGATGKIHKRTLRELALRKLGL